MIKSKETEEKKDGFVKVKPKTYEVIGKGRFWPKPKRQSNERVVDLAEGDDGE